MMFRTLSTVFSLFSKTLKPGTQEVRDTDGGGQGAGSGKSGQP